MAGKKGKPRAPYGARQIEKLVRRQGLGSVAKKLGVAPATLKGWQKKGVPERRRVDVRKAARRSDRSAKAASKSKKVRRDLRVMVKHGKSLLEPVTQVFFDRETGAILGTSYDKNGNPEIRRAILRRWWDPKTKRWKNHAWWAFGHRLEGYTPESFFSRYEEAFGGIPKAEVWIDWNAGPVIVRMATVRSAA